MAGRKKNCNITSASIFEVFNYYLYSNDSLQGLLKRLFSNKKGKTDKLEDIEKKIKVDEALKSVAKHVNAFHDSGNDLDYFNTFSRNDEKILKKLARMFVDLQPLFDSENGFPLATNTIGHTQDELKDNFSEKQLTEKEKFISDFGKNKVKKTIDLNLVYRWNDIGLFVGRKDEIAELKSKISRQKRVIINGIRGIGKTGLVQAYLFYYSDLYDHIIWITVCGDIKESFVKAIHEIKAFKESGYSKSDDIKMMLNNCLHFLCQFNGNNLIIFDNVSHDEQISEINSLFNRIRNWTWKSIFTTYSNISRPKPIELNKLKPADAFNAFKSYYLEETTPEEAKKIESLFSREEKQIKEMLRKINYHTLLIELLAKVDIEDEALTLHNLFEIVKETSSIKSPRLNIAVQPNIINDMAINISPEELTPYKYIRAIFEKDLENLNPEQIKVLQFFASLPSKPLLLKDLTNKIRLNKDSLPCIMNSLKGWIKYDEITKSYSMEELYQFAVREYFSKQVCNAKTIRN